MQFGFQVFNIIGIIVPLFFIVIVGLLVFILVRNISLSRKNDNAPRLTVPATVVTKRTRVSGGEHTSTAYYVTFQVESGDRMELHLQGHEYGMLVEGDRGNLTFQGTRFLRFERT